MDARTAPAVAFPVPFDSDAVQRVLRRLPARQRAALCLRFGQGLTEREVAQVLGCRVVTAHAMVVRAVRRTLRMLADDSALSRHPGGAYATMTSLTDLAR